MRLGLGFGLNFAFAFFSIKPVYSTLLLDEADYILIDEEGNRLTDKGGEYIAQPLKTELLDELSGRLLDEEGKVLISNLK